MNSHRITKREFREFLESNPHLSERFIKRQVEHFSEWSRENDAARVQFEQEINDGFLEFVRKAQLAKQQYLDALK